MSQYDYKSLDDYHLSTLTLFASRVEKKNVKTVIYAINYL